MGNFAFNKHYLDKCVVYQARLDSRRRGTILMIFFFLLFGNSTNCTPFKFLNIFRTFRQTFFLDLHTNTHVVSYFEHSFMYTYTKYTFVHNKSSGL